MAAFSSHGNYRFHPTYSKVLFSKSPTQTMLHKELDQDWKLAPGIFTTVPQCISEWANSRGHNSKMNILIRLEFEPDWYFMPVLVFWNSEDLIRKEVAFRRTTHIWPFLALNIRQVRSRLPNMAEISSNLRLFACDLFICKFESIPLKKKSKTYIT